MGEVLLFLVAFVAIVVDVVDAILDWLASRGLSGWLLAIGAFLLVGFHFVNKWSVEIAGRIHAIEHKLGIEPPPPQKTIKHVWLMLLFWFLVAVYLLGKSLQAEGAVLVIGIAISGCMLLLSALCAYGLIDQAVRDYWRRNREWRELIDKLYANDEKAD
jgi:hypothetical protein